VYTDYAVVFLVKLEVRTEVDCIRLPPYARQASKPGETRLGVVGKEDRRVYRFCRKPLC